MKSVWIGACGVMIAMSVVGLADGKPLSDLNVPAFQKETAPVGGPAVESPFVPKEVGKEELLVQDLRLTGIAIGASSGFALISGNVVQLNDQLAGYHVRQIATDHVVLQHLDKRVVLRLQGGL